MMSDLLSAVSILAGVSGVLYSVWYPEMRAALALEVPAYGRDVGLRQVKAATMGRALPIVLLLAALTACLAPPALEIFSDTFAAMRDGKGKYDALKAAFVVVYAALAILLVAVSRDLVGLIGLWRRFKQPVQPA